MWQALTFLWHRLQSLLQFKGDATKGKVDFFCVNQAMLDTFLDRQQASVFRGSLVFYQALPVFPSRPAEEMQKWTKDLDAMA